MVNINLPCNHHAITCSSVHEYGFLGAKNKSLLLEANKITLLTQGVATSSFGTDEQEKNMTSVPISVGSLILCNKTLT